MLQTPDLLVMQAQREAVHTPFVLAGQSDYIANIAAPIAGARQESMSAIVGEAVLIQAAGVNDVAATEIVSWRADSVMTRVDDEKINFATRARLRVSEAVGVITAPQDLLLPDKVNLRSELPKDLRRQIPKRGVYIHGMEYRDIVPREETGPAPITPFNLTQIVHVRGGKRHVLTVDQNKGTVVEFPLVPPYKEVCDGAYAAFYAQKSQDAPTATMLRMNLDEARVKDATKIEPADRPEVARALRRDAPPDMHERLHRLGRALYGQQQGEPLTAELAAALMDPYTPLAAQIAVNDKWSYRLPGKGGVTPPILTHQMQEVYALAATFQYEVHSAAVEDKLGAAEMLQLRLDQLGPMVAKAKIFAHHLTANETLPTTGDSWQVRAR